MKRKLFLFALAGALVLINFSSCNKDEEEPQAISEDEAATEIENAVSSNSQGFASQVTYSANVAGDYASSAQKSASMIDSSGVCGMTDGDTFSINLDSMSQASFNYSFQWNWTISCTNSSPVSLDFDCDGGGSYDGPNAAWDGNFTYNYQVTDLISTTEHYVYNGNYTRKGSSEMKTGNKSKFSSKITISSTNLKVNKYTYRIEDGTTSVDITGDDSNGNSYAYSGTISYNNDGTATLNISEGGTHTIQVY